METLFRRGFSRDEMKKRVARFKDLHELRLFINSSQTGVTARGHPSISLRLTETGSIRK